MALLSQVSTSYPRVPRDSIFPQLWDIFIVWIQTLPIYPANNIRRASSRILIAAFRSRSIRFPHVQRYTLSESFSSFFILPHLQHFLLEGKKRSTRTNFFPLHVRLIFQQFPKLSVTVIHDTFSKMHTLAHCFHINIFYCNNIICLCYFMTQFMCREIFPLVSDFFMT